MWYISFIVSGLRFPLLVLLPPCSRNHTAFPSRLDVYLINNYVWFNKLQNISKISFLFIAISTSFDMLHIFNKKSLTFLKYIHVRVWNLF